MSKFYYNGILLPDIPTEHLATNPYIWIRKNQRSGYYDLLLGNDKWYYSSSAVYPANSVYWYQIPLDGYESYDEWVFNEETTGSFGVDTNRTVLWSNYSIPSGSTTSTTLYYPKCERIIYTNEKLKFNDIKLPMLPTEYLSSNPYVFIRKNNTSGFYDLVLGASAWYYDSSNIRVSPSGTDLCYWYRIPIVDSESYIEWEYYKSTTGNFGLDSNRALLWSLQDVSNGKNSSTIYFSTSAPVVDLTIIKYLIRDNNIIYTVTEGALAEVTGELNSNLFIDNGIDTIPDGALLMTLATPEVLCWTNADTVPKLTATVTATPQSQVIITDKIYLTDKSITGIESVLATCEGELIVAVSFDDKQTWKAWNGEQWATLSDDNTGMSKETLEGITFEQWNELYTGATGFYVRVSLLDTTQSVEKIVFDFSN